MQRAKACCVRFSLSCCEGIFFNGFKGTHKEGQHRFIFRGAIEQRTHRTHVKNALFKQPLLSVPAKNGGQVAPAENWYEIRTSTSHAPRSSGKNGLQPAPQVPLPIEVACFRARHLLDLAASTGIFFLGIGSPETRNQSKTLGVFPFWSPSTWTPSNQRFCRGQPGATHTAWLRLRVSIPLFSSILPPPAQTKKTSSGLKGKSPWPVLWTTCFPLSFFSPPKSQSRSFNLRTAKARWHRAPRCCTC